MLVLTGAAGFIGSNTLTRLNEMGCVEIICADDLSGGSDKFKNLVGKEFAEYVDYPDLFRAVKKQRLHGIIHLGACADTSGTFELAMMDQNYVYSKQLIQLAEKKHCPLVYASSASVYGAGAHGFTEGLAFEGPASIYAFSKWALDHYVRYATGSEGHITVPVAGVRYFNVYGPGEQHKAHMMSLAGKLFQAAQAGHKTYLYNGSEEFRRDFVYVDDAVNATLFLIHNRISGIFNVGTGAPRSFTDMANIAAKCAGKKLEDLVEFIDMPTDMAVRYQTYTCADIKKLQETGYSTDFITLEEGMARYWAALQKGEHHGPA